MSYYVEYNPELNTRYPRSIHKKIRLNKAKYVITLMIIVGGLLLFKEDIMDIIIPGDNEITTSAVSSMIESVKAGEPIYESIVTFCEEIIVNAT